LTRYTVEELEGDWEFKIVRTLFGSFHRPVQLKRLIADEAQAGWIFLEKLDDQRVRFKRPVNARERDARLPSEVDPYRTNLDGRLGFGVVALLAGVTLLAVLGLVITVLVLR